MGHTAGTSAHREYRRRLKRLRALQAVRSLTVVVFGVAAGAAAWFMSPSAGSRVGVGLAGLGAAAIAAVGLPRPDARLPGRWSAGARGERATASYLSRVEGRRVAVLHDRVVPGGRWNIDHIVVTRAGVFTVDSKSATGRVRKRFGRLSISGRDGRDVVEQAARQADMVDRALGGVRDAGLCVQAVVCVHGARLPRRRLRVRGVRIVDGRRLVRLLRRRRGAVPAGLVEEIAERIDRAFPPAAHGATRGKRGARDTRRG